MPLKHHARGGLGTSAMDAEKDEEKNNLRTFICQQLDKFFIQHLPMESLKEMPPLCKKMI